MSMGPRLIQRIDQRLVITPRLQQSLNVLRLSMADLNELVSEEADRNPALEAEFPWAKYLSYTASRPLPYTRATTDDLPRIEDRLTRSETLFDHLMAQLAELRMTRVDRGVAVLILGELDAAGRLDRDFVAIARDAGVSVATAARVLERLWQLDPPGVCARSGIECLVIQARRARMGRLVVRVLEEHAADLARRRYDAIARALGRPIDEILEAHRKILTLDPRPARQFGEEEARPISPDLRIWKDRGEWIVTLNDDGLPKLRVNPEYREMLERGGRERAFARGKLAAAQRVIRDIRERQKNILAVAKSIVRFQVEFFEHGVAHLKPLIMQRVAEDVGIHESTVSRATNQKYADTPYGILELKYFFKPAIPSSNGGGEVASEAVRSRIREIAAAEDPECPVSDSQIVERLSKRGIRIARRTVAKYREQLGILSAAARRRLF